MSACIERLKCQSTFSNISLKYYQCFERSGPEPTMASNNHVDHVLKDLVQIVACSLDFVFLRKQVFFHLTNRKSRRIFFAKEQITHLGSRNDFWDAT